LLRIARKFGGRTERTFLALIYLMIPVAAFVFMILSYGTGWFRNPSYDSVEAYEMLSMIVSFLLIGFFNQAQMRPVYSPAALREIARKRIGPGSPERWSSLARYLEEWGKRGHLPGEIRLGYISWEIFYTLLFSGIVLVYLLFPFLGRVTVGISATVIGGFGFSFWFRSRRRVSCSTTTLSGGDISSARGRIRETVHARYLRPLPVAGDMFGEFVSNVMIPEKSDHQA